MRKNFWSGKRVLVTGHTGFKGGWLSLWLQSLGAEVIGVSLPPPTVPCIYDQARVADGMISLREDIRNGNAIKAIMQKCMPEIVFHLAAQPLVRYSYLKPVETYETNVMGTLHVLEAIRRTGATKAVVMVTTDKCYENREILWGYRENEPMGGFDPYSSSKGACELLISSYRNSYFSHPSEDTARPALASARSGNVIGGGDWAEDRLIPDAIRNFQTKQTAIIRNPSAVRPWQHVLEPLAGYMQLAERLYDDAAAEFAEPWNFGPGLDEARSVRWVMDRLSNLWGEGATWQLDSAPHPHEANILRLDSSKANIRLDWNSVWSLDEALQKTVDWYKAAELGQDLYEFSLQQISEYMKSKEVNE